MTWRNSPTTRQGFNKFWYKSHDVSQPYGAEFRNAVRTRSNQLSFLNFMSAQPGWVGVGFSESDSAPVAKFLQPHPGPNFFQIWKSDFCSNSGNHLEQCHSLSFIQTTQTPATAENQKWQTTKVSDSGPVFHKLLTPALKKYRILPESTPALRIRGHQSQARTLTT